MTRSIGFLAGLGYVEYQADKVVGTLFEQGYQAVSWPLYWFDPERKNDEDRKKLVKSTTDRGMVVSEWVVQIDYISRDFEVRRSRVNHTLDILRALACLEVRAPVNLFTGPAPWDPTAPRLGKEISEGQAWNMLYSAFDQIIPEAEKLGLTLAIEPVFGHLVHEYYTLRELLHHYQSDHLCVNFDPSHGVLYGNDTPWVISQLGNKIVHVHIKDAVGKPGGLPGETFEFPLIGEGQVPWNEMFKALDEINYRGCLTVEFEAFKYYESILRNNPEAASQLSMDNIRQILSIEK
jgi:sugar phosphate isomerase/epimerase